MIAARSKASPRRLALRAPSSDPLLFKPTWTPDLIRRLVRRDPESPIAAWRQLAEQFREAIAIGQLPPGTMLPPLSSMAEALDVYLDGALAARSVGFEQVTPYAKVAVGTHTLTAVPAGSPPGGSSTVGCSSLSTF